MFTVKATYNGESRRFWLNGEEFPPYDFIHNQLLRVFPIRGPYYFSNVLFSPAGGPRVPVGKEIRNESEYNEQITRFAGQPWLNGLLRFTVMDEPELKLPGGLAAPSESIFHNQQGSPETTCDNHDSPHVDAKPDEEAVVRIMDLHNSVLKAKDEMKDLLSNFIGDLNKMMANAFEMDAARSSSTAGSRDLSGFSSTQRDNVEAVDVSIPGAFLQGATSKQRDLNEKQALQQPEASSLVSPDRLSAGGASRSRSICNARAPQRLNSVEGPIHANVLCDHCCNVIVGHRHKCLDCRDYDLCNRCFPVVSSIHNAFHEFFTITEPGRVIVHTVHDGVRGDTRTLGANPSTESPRNVDRGLLSHGATCDLCDSRIYGVRYKCLTCPDFDTCSSCYTITSEQHPVHTFVRIEQPQNLSSRDTRTFVRHNVRCDECKATIYGIRYKCMHPDCSDYDLCAKCEAMPIEVHPTVHPMLKMRTPESFIPLMHRSRAVNAPWGPSRPGTPRSSAPTERLTVDSAISSHATRKPECSEASVHVDVKPEVAEASVHTESNPSKFDASTETERDVREGSSHGRFAATTLVEEFALSPEPFSSSQIVVDKLQELANRWKESAPSISDVIAAQEISRVMSSVPALLSDLVAKVPQKTVEILLSTFVSDANINDGQEFPAGAEFVKTWQVRNDGNVPWPESTEVIFVAGDRMPAFDSAPLSYHIGAVDPGVTVDITACDMKAPDVQGKYVGYWRLSDGSRPFGQSFWCDITVRVPEGASGNNDSLAASEVVMPGLAQAHSTSRQPSLSIGEAAATSIGTHTVVSESHISDDDSSISLLDDLDSTSDDELWETSRRNQPSIVNGSRDTEYVLCEEDADEE